MSPRIRKKGKTALEAGKGLKGMKGRKKEGGENYIYALVCGKKRMSLIAVPAYLEGGKGSLSKEKESRRHVKKGGPLPRYPKK